MGIGQVSVLADSFINMSPIPHFPFQEIRVICGDYCTYIEVNNFLVKLVDWEFLLETEYFPAQFHIFLLSAGIVINLRNLQNVCIIRLDIQMHAKFFNRSLPEGNAGREINPCPHKQNQLFDQICIV